MRQFRYLLLTLVLTGCPGSDPKSGDTDDTVDTDTPGVDTPDTDDTPDTPTDTGETDSPVDTDEDSDTGPDTDTDTTPGQGTADTGPIDSFVPPMGSGDTGGGGPPPTPTPPGPTGMTPDTGDTSIGGGETGGGITDTDPCNPDEVLDCNGECFPAVLLGDGTCHIGGFGNPDFFCEDLDWDDGDCPNGDTGTPPPQQCNGPVDVQDCDGVCYPITWVGDGRCDDGSNGSANFDCILFSYDNGDCTSTSDSADTDTGVTPLVDTNDTNDTGADTNDTGMVIDTSDTAN